MDKKNIIVDNNKNIDGTMDIPSYNQFDVKEFVGKRILLVVSTLLTVEPFVQFNDLTD